MAADYSSIDVGFGAVSRKFYYRKDSSDEKVIKEVLADRWYDLNLLDRTPELIALLRQLAARNVTPLVVDAGANIGASVIHFFAALMPVIKPMIVAIEPHAENFHLLRKNVEGLDVRAIHGALSSTSGNMRVVDPGKGHWGYRTEQASDHRDDATVPCVTLNDIFHEAGARRLFPFIVKVDIEGAEEDLFKRNTGWIDRTPLLIIELHDWLLQKQGTSRPFLKCIAERDRDFVSIRKEVYSIANNLDQMTGWTRDVSAV